MPDVSILFVQSNDLAKRQGDDHSRPRLSIPDLNGFELGFGVGYRYGFQDFDRDQLDKGGEEMSAMITRTAVCLFSVLLVVGAGWAQEESTVDGVEGVGEEQECRADHQNRK